jgi:hypothetical protein
MTARYLVEMSNEELLDEYVRAVARAAGLPSSIAPVLEMLGLQGAGTLPDWARVASESHLEKAAMARELILKRMGAEERWWGEEEP